MSRSNSKEATIRSVRMSSDIVSLRLLNPMITIGEYRATPQKLYTMGALNAIKTLRAPGKGWRRGHWHINGFGQRSTRRETVEKG